MSDIFISYARSTAKQAQQVAEGLLAMGYGVWIDDDLPAHRTYSRVIEEELTASKAAMGRRSGPTGSRIRWRMSLPCRTEWR